MFDLRPRLFISEYFPRKITVIVKRLHLKADHPQRLSYNCLTQIILLALATWKGLPGDSHVGQCKI